MKNWQFFLVFFSKSISNIKTFCRDLRGHCMVLSVTFLSDHSLTHNARVRKEMLKFHVSQIGSSNKHFLPLYLKFKHKVRTEIRPIYSSFMLLEMQHCFCFLLLICYQNWFPHRAWLWMPQAIAFSDSWQEMQILAWSCFIKDNGGISKSYDGSRFQ